MEKEIYEKIISKKDFSQLIKKDVEIVWNYFEKRQVSDEEKIRLTRDMLRKVFSVFSSVKLLGLKNQDRGFEWFLKKHISTRERFDFYGGLYSRLLKDFLVKKLTIFDLGAGVNGFSYNYLNKLNNGCEYIAVEAVGQLVDLMNYYFKMSSLPARAIHESLFELEKIKKSIKQVKGDKIIFLFKVLDSLEMLERDYSKKLLLELVPLVDRVVVSFATRSLVSKKKFKVRRYWFENFIKENFEIIGDFELGTEKYFIFKNK